MTKDANNPSVCSTVVMAASASCHFDPFAWANQLVNSQADFMRFLKSLRRSAWDAPPNGEDWEDWWGSGADLMVLDRLQALMDANDSGRLQTVEGVLAALREL